MIQLKDAKLTDGLPQIIASEPWAQAMAYAVNRQMQQLITYAAGTLVSVSVDTMPSGILDILAIELRIPYYDSTDSIAVKRELIKGAIPYWATAGSVDSLTKILVDIFGDAVIEEWFEYSGTAQHFRIRTSNPNVTGAVLTRFQAVARDSKRLSAYLDQVIVDLSLPNMAFIEGFLIEDFSETTLTQEG